MVAGGTPGKSEWRTVPRTELAIALMCLLLCEDAIEEDKSNGKKKDVKVVVDQA
jgi:hypothetical protein